MPNRQNSIDRLEEFRQITAEFDVLKNRVRRIIGKRHFPTDGEWKESIVRTFLRRNLPDNIKVGRGFVITPEDCTSQIDVLVYDTEKPVLFREDDLVCISPDAVKAIIEVKTRLYSSKVHSVLRKLSNNIELIRSHMGYRAISGLIAIEESNTSKRKLAEELSGVAENNSKRAIHLVSIGHDTFVKYHDFWRNKESGNLREHKKWHMYNLQKCAPAYFLVNIIDSICGDSVQMYPELWYPKESKEKYLEGTISLNGDINMYG